MSRNSFPRPEHAEALLAYAQKLAGGRGGEIRVAGAGLDRFRCHYRIEVRNEFSGVSEVVGVHFQLAERLVNLGSSGSLDQLLAEAFRKCQPDPGKPNGP